MLGQRAVASCGSWARSHSSGRCTSGSSNSRSAWASRARVTPSVRRRGGDRFARTWSRLAVEVGVRGRVHDAPPRSGPSVTTDHGCPPMAGSTRGTGSASTRAMCRSTRTWTPTTAGIGAQVGELHHVALVAAGPEQEVVVGLAGQPGELAGQAVAPPGWLRPPGARRPTRTASAGPRPGPGRRTRRGRPLPHRASRRGLFDHGENLARRGGSAGRCPGARRRTGVIRRK